MTLFLLSRSAIVLFFLPIRTYSRKGSSTTTFTSHPLSFSQLTLETKLQIPTSIIIDHNEDEAAIVSSMLQNVESSSKLLLEGAPHRMNYGIFNGESSLRTLSSRESPEPPLPEPKPKPKLLLPEQNSKNKALNILLLLLEQRLDQAHEMVLGVTVDNLQDAEYAATHPGETSWSADHPLTTLDDILHCIIHRFEGENKSVEGGGRATGYDNAKYWLAGGDKELECMGEHDLWLFMKDYVTANDERFGCLNLVSQPCIKEDFDTTRRKYLIIASGGKERYVFVNPKMWDEFRFIDLCALRYANNQDSSDNLEGELKIVWEKDWSPLIDELQLVQLQFLFRLALKQAFSST